MNQPLEPGHRDYVCPPSEYDPRPSESATELQRANKYAFEHKDDGWDPPVSSGGPAPDVRIYSDDPPPQHSG